MTNTKFTKIAMTTLLASSIENNLQASEDANWAEIFTPKSLKSLRDLEANCPNTVDIHENVSKRYPNDGSLPTPVREKMIEKTSRRLFDDQTSKRKIINQIKKTALKNKDELTDLETEYQNKINQLKESLLFIKSEKESINAELEIKREELENLKKTSSSSDQRSQNAISMLFVEIEVLENQLKDVQQQYEYQLLQSDKLNHELKKSALQLEIQQPLLDAVQKMTISSTTGSSSAMERKSSDEKKTTDDDDSESDYEGSVDISKDISKTRK